MSSYTEIRGCSSNGEKSTAEDEADVYASDVLIPCEYQHRLPRTRDIAAVKELAGEIGIAPSIVLGRAQRETRDFAWGQSLRRTFEWVEHPV